MNKVIDIQTKRSIQILPFPEEAAKKIIAELAEKDLMRTIDELIVVGFIIDYIENNAGLKNQFAAPGIVDDTKEGA